MPRHRRLNILGAIHHVITRGLNRQDIFLDDCDRNDFLGRFEKNLSLTGGTVISTRTDTPVKIIMFQDTMPNLALIPGPSILSDYAI